MKQPGNHGPAAMPSNVAAQFSSVDTSPIEFHIQPARSPGPPATTDSQYVLPACSSGRTTEAALRTVGPVVSPGTAIFSRIAPGRPLASVCKDTRTLPGV